MKVLKILGIVGLVGGAFVIGYVTRVARTPTAPQAPSERRVLYYVDPMHPAYTSDKPGVAPDCGMTLEPVYADSVRGAADEQTDHPHPPNAVHIADRIPFSSRQNPRRESKLAGAFSGTVHYLFWLIRV